MEPRDDVKSALNTLIFSVMFLLLFCLLLPVLVKVLDQTAGKALYGVLAAGAVWVAVRLRALSRRM
jgi:hypothetical protein